ncbi:AsmA family protein [Pedobacter sp. L105]|uniref:AsmA family protein n=1 Tax=Pedobacter sp. L105 TaxID=1641871 RepID=UPI00131C9CAC|nr:AsmA family protein [Pedobacter sp. L105]
MSTWIKRSLQIFISLILLVIVIFLGLAFYVNIHKKTLLVSITKELNKNLNGSLTVGSMEPTFLQGFPGVSISLKNVEIKDSLWKVHHHSLLTAKDLDVAVNTMALLRGTIDIRKVSINDASIYLYTDSNGYSNSSILKKKPAPVSKEKRTSPAEISLFELNNVRFILDNRKGNKLFLFAIQDFSGKVDYPSSGWKAAVNLNVLVRSLAFNTKNGSFAKDKFIKGKMDVGYDKETGVIEVKPAKLAIGDDPFIIGATFNIAKDPTEFTINIEARNILWRNASALLAHNISLSLNMFNMDRPIAAKCIIKGDMGGGGDPSIFVNASIKNNRLSFPGGVVDNCSFAGVYTNNFINGKGFTDDNSAIKLYRFSASYKDIPFTIDTAFLRNMNTPLVMGTFNAKFDVSRFNNILGNDLLKFTRGTATLQLHYQAEIAKLQLIKPKITGIISVKNSDVSYVPRNVNFKNTSVTLDFRGADLLIKDIRLESGRSVVFMEGSIKNFMNVYYTDPEKAVISWKMRSPDLYLGEFIGFLGLRKDRKVMKSKNKSSSFADQFNTMLEKGEAEINIRVDKVHYNRFFGTDAKADIFLTREGLSLKNVSMKNAGGSISMNGNIGQTDKLSKFNLNAVVSNTSIRDFFYAFDNFGLKSLTYKNLRGQLSAKAKVTGNITDQGKVISHSIDGTLSFELKNGALDDFESFKSVGKFAFPFRDLNHITLNDLKGNFILNGEKITIDPMQISSSVLNMDIAGVYSLGKGTNILLDIPLRNPKKDADIADKQEVNDRRMKGIVVHVQAIDGDNGKIKFKLLRNKDKFLGL